MTGLDRALYFDKNITVYTTGRPEYPSELYDIIRRYIPEDGKTILEIGAGNGLASRKLLSFLNPRKMVLLEPGKNFCRLLTEKYSDDMRVSIVCSDFENYRPKDRFDVIVAATAWHWLDQATKYQSVRNLLNNNGRLVVFWNNFHLVEGDVKNCVDEVYKKYDKEYNRHVDQSFKITERKKEFQQSNLFELEANKIIYEELGLSAARYINLLQTYPDHELFGPDFLKDIRQAVEKCGGVVTMRLSTDLLIGKPKEIFV